MQRLIWIAVLTGAMSLSACQNDEIKVNKRYAYTNVTEQQSADLEVMIHTGLEQMDESAFQPEWMQTFKADVPYVHISSSYTFAYSGPNRGYAKLGKVSKGNGGLIETCEDNLKWCKLKFSGNGATAWVEMLTFRAATEPT